MSRNDWKYSSNGSMSGNRSPMTPRRVADRNYSESEGGCSTDNELTDSEIAPAPTTSGLRLTELSTSDVPFRAQKIPPEVVTALFDYTANKEDELTLKKGTVIEVVCKDPNVCGGEGWWTGRLNGKLGVFPSNYVQINVQAALHSLHLDIRLPDPPTIPFSHLRYKRADLIGQGGFGTVYRAYWKEKIVAVKQARIGSGEDVRSIEEAVKQEARLFHLLSHRNIVILMGLCVEPPNLCLVLEYCAGGSLTRLLSGGNIPADILIDWAVQIARGMYYLHEEAPVCLVHRDLKSGNILVKESLCEHPSGHHTPTSSCGRESLSNLTLKITDFGLAREACTGTSRMSVCGTYAWMAPEVIKSSTFSKASDVWSFGVLLWELLTGETPYKGMDALAVAYAVATEKLQLHIPTTCPEHLSDIMTACWSNETHKRPTFAELIAKLEQLPVELQESWAEMDDTSFHSLQEGWRKEIEDLLAETKERESELRCREEELRKVEEEQMAKAKEQAIREEQLLEKEKTIREREIEVVERELGWTLLQLKFDQPKPAKRHSRLRKGVLKKLMRKGPNNSGSNISAPTGFNHVLTVQKVTSSSGIRASSESPPVSPNARSQGKLQVIALTPTTPPDGETPRGAWGPEHHNLRSSGSTSALGRIERPPLPGVSKRKKSSPVPNGVDVKITRPAPSDPSLSNPVGSTPGTNGFHLTVVAPEKPPRHHRSTPNLAKISVGPTTNISSGRKDSNPSNHSGLGGAGKRSVLLSGSSTLNGIPGLLSGYRQTTDTLNSRHANAQTTGHNHVNGISLNQGNGNARSERERKDSEDWDDARGEYPSDLPGTPRRLGGGSGRFRRSSSSTSNLRKGSSHSTTTPSTILTPVQMVGSILAGAIGLDIAKFTPSSLSHAAQERLGVPDSRSESLSPQLAGSWINSFGRTSGASLAALYNARAPSGTPPPNMIQGSAHRPRKPSHPVLSSPWLQDSASSSSRTLSSSPIKQPSHIPRKDTRNPSISSTGIQSTRSSHSITGANHGHPSLENQSSISSSNKLSPSTPGSIAPPLPSSSSSSVRISKSKPQPGPATQTYRIRTPTSDRRTPLNERRTRRDPPPIPHTTTTQSTHSHPSSGQAYSRTKSCEDWSMDSVTSSTRIHQATLPPHGRSYSITNASPHQGHQQSFQDPHLEVSGVFALPPPPPVPSSHQRHPPLPPRTNLSGDTLVPAPQGFQQSIPGIGTHVPHQGHPSHEPVGLRSHFAPFNPLTPIIGPGLNSLSNPNYEPHQFPTKPERPTKLDLRSNGSGQTPMTPAESGISTGGSSFVSSFPPSEDRTGSANLLDVPDGHQPLDKTPPLPPRLVPGPQSSLSPVGPSP